MVLFICEVFGIYKYEEIDSAHFIFVDKFIECTNKDYGCW